MMDGGIAIIGGGNLGAALAEGLVAAKVCAAEQIHVTRRRSERIAHLTELGLQVGQDNLQAVGAARWILLTVEPTQARAVLRELAPALDVSRHVLVSCVTGIDLDELAVIVGADQPCLRAMPNTAVAIRQSLTCVTTRNADEPTRADVMRLFESVGRVLFIEEGLMGAATVLGACGVAFSMRFIRAASQGGTEIGFDAQSAQLIAAQTALGAAALLMSREDHPEREIDRVTTPRGCTIAGLNEMEHQGFSSSLIKGITTSYEKIATIARELDDGGA